MSDPARFPWTKRLESLRGRLGELARLRPSSARDAATRLAKTVARTRRHARERRILLASGLFDVSFYRTQGAFEGDAITHYLVRGATEGRRPHPLFDTSYYRRWNPDVGIVNPFVHYLTVGGPSGRRPNAYFDGASYLAQDPALPVGTEPLGHFMREGGRRGRRPGHDFDPDFYLSEHPEVAESGDIPLVHYLRVGMARGFSPSPNGPIRGTYLLAPMPTLPTEAEWLEVRPHRPDDAVVDVIVPVYRGEADTLRAIQRVLASHNELRFELVVIDDHSPEPTLSARLAELGDRGLFTYLRNQENLGFVGTVNRGMALHPGRDVLLLNSDTEAFGDWLDRIHRVATSDEHIGTVTPFSNSATICSYPKFPEDNAMALELSFEELDALAASTNGAMTQHVELPTAVGFCMYITRRCLDATGLFDEALFGKGYGEENDFCRRALARGFRSVLAADVFVRHTGGASFQGEKAERVERALAILREVHPDYLPAVAEFVGADPIRPLRERLDVARVRRVVGERAFAIVSHNLGGGTEQHIRELIAMAARENVGVLMLRPDETSSDRVAVSMGVDAPLPNLPTLRLDDPATTIRFLEAVGIRHVHVHHVLGFDASVTEWLVRVARAPTLTVDFTIHDYAPICPRINLVGERGVYCGEPEEAACVRCLTKLGSHYETRDIAGYRARHRAMLGAMRRVVVPNLDVKQRIERHYPELDTIVMPHAERVRSRARGARYEPGERLVVAALGHVGSHKGFDLLVGCAEDARRRGLPLDFAVVGFTSDDARARAAGVRVTGSYQSPDEAIDAITRIGAHVGFFPAVWPETHSYTLTLALEPRLHPVAFALGAIAERLGRLGGGTILPVDALRDAARVNDALVALTQGALPEAPEPESRDYVLADYYGDRV